MSSSPQEPQEDAGDVRDELEPQTGGDETEGGTTALDAPPPVKRGRGRPKGSKNKKAGTASSSTAAVTSPTSTTPRKRGRPPKEKKAEESGTDEPAPKRKRGRPPKTPKADVTVDGAVSGETAESSTKKKRGRPPKKA